MLVILTTHPIQYQVPLWQRLAEAGEVEFEVWYMSDHAVRPSLDRDFGRVFAWDLDLLSGYPHRFLPGPQDITSFRGTRLDDFGAALEKGGATTLFVNGWQTAGYWTAVWAAHRTGIPVWLRGESNDLHRTPVWKRWVKRRLLERLFARVDRFLAIGTANRRLYRSYGVAERRLREAPYAVDNARFAAEAARLAPQRAALRARWGIEPDAFCVLFAGKLIAKKRPHDLVEAARLLSQPAGRPGSEAGPALHLLFVGDGPLRESLRAECRDGRDDHSPGALSTVARPRATFTGFLNQSEIPEAYAVADCLALPSDHRETWGLVVNEAMASGVPCAVSDACGCAEDLVAPLDRGFVFRGGDPADLARALRRLAAHPPERARLRAHIGRFSFDQTVATIRDLAVEAASHAPVHVRG